MNDDFELMFGVEFNGNGGFRLENKGSSIAVYGESTSSRLPHYPAFKVSKGSMFELRDWLNKELNEHK